MGQVTIHTYDQQWEGASIVGMGMDTLTIHGVLFVRHPAFDTDLSFYVVPDEQGRRFQAGNSAFWIEAALCPKCHTIVDQADLFCGQCGTQLESDIHPTQQLES